MKGTKQNLILYVFYYILTNYHKILFLNGDNMEIEGLKIRKELNEMLLKVYPVGSIYMSVSNVDPSTLFGGTWQRWGKGRFPISVDESDVTGHWDGVEMTGGIQENTLIIANLPAHNHRINGSTSSDGQHGHSLATANGQSNLEWGYMFSYDGHNAAYNSGAFSSNSGTHSHTMNFLSQNTGSGQAISNMPPFISVYMWKRTK